MNALNRYQNVQVMTADGVRIIIMLCEGIIRFNAQAEKAIEDGDVEQRCRCLNKSLDIINELSNSLNMEAGGEVALNLARLYDFCAEKLTNANLYNDASLIRPVTRVVGELKAGWETVARENSGTGVDAGLEQDGPGLAGGA